MWSSLLVGLSSLCEGARLKDQPLHHLHDFRSNTTFLLWHTSMKVVCAPDISVRFLLHFPRRSYSYMNGSRTLNLGAKYCVGWSRTFSEIRGATTRRLELLHESSAKKQNAQQTVSRGRVPQVYSAIIRRTRVRRRVKVSSQTFRRQRSRDRFLLKSLDTASSFIY